jgi:hypothetical protein
MDGLLAWYPMTSGGLTEYDISGNGRHGTYGGGIGSPAINQGFGHVGTGREFRANSDGLLTGVPALLEYTLSFWLMRGAFSSGNQIAVSLNHPTDAFRRYTLGSAIGGFVGSSFEHTSADFGWLKVTHQRLWQWYHICFVRRGNNITGGYTLYVDGEEFNSRNTGNFQIDGTDNWSIGAIYQNGAWVSTPWTAFSLNSGLSNFRFYDHEISQRQMAEMTADPWAPMSLRAPPFPPTGLSPVPFGPVSRGLIRSAQERGSIRIGGAS